MGDKKPKAKRKKGTDITGTGPDSGAPAKKRKGAKTQVSTPQNQFPPTLGELDLHLFGEGKHERIYERLGAHLITHEGQPGVAFAVWAPNAKTVSVVGNFNEWNGAKHQMRVLESSGVWELFVPDLGAGELYKYEIKHGRRKFLKADPYAFMMQVPPDTSSITFKPNYKFQDRAWMTRRQKRDRKRIYTCRVSAAQGTSVWAFMGISSQCLLRCFIPVRHAR